jgi:hypothetical protein
MPSVCVHTRYAKGNASIFQRPSDLEILLLLSLELGRPRQKDDLDENPQAKEASSGDSNGKTGVHDHHHDQGLNISICSLLNKTNWSLKLIIACPMDLVHPAVQSIDFFGGFILST